MDKSAMWFSAEVEILGETYRIYERSEQEDDRLNECSGLCDWTKKEIVVRRSEEDRWDLGDMKEFTKKVLRHEITHAMLIESGLDECSGGTDAWAKNEAMVDWIARQGIKLYKAWKAAEAV